MTEFIILYNNKQKIKMCNRVFKFFFILILYHISSHPLLQIKIIKILQKTEKQLGNNKQTFSLVF